jgi:hypothetical protein
MKKIIIFLVATLLITAVLPAMGLTISNEKKNNASINNECIIPVCETNKDKNVLNKKIEDFTYVNSIKINYQLKNGVLDQSQTSDCGYGWNIHEDQWIAQGFTPTLEILSKIELKLFKAGEPPENLGFTVSIRNSLDGTNLRSITTNSLSLPGYGRWVEFDFEDLPVITGEKYYIICRADGGEYSNCFCWLYDINDPYENGSAWSSHDDGDSWYPAETDEHTDTDCCFKTYGPGEESIPSIPDTPDGPEEGETNEEMTYYTKAIDPLEKQLYYQWNWGDGTTSNWLGPHDSGEIVSASNNWDVDGIYIVKVKAKNTDEIESEWSNPLIVGIPLKNDGEDQSQETCDGHAYGIYVGGAFAQSFIPTQDTLTNVQLYINKLGNPDKLKISIRKELEGKDITSIVKLADEFPDDKAKWIKFDFPDIEVNAGTIYYIVWTPGEVSDEQNIFYWLFGENNRYPYGGPWEGFPWREFNPSQYEDIDFCFKTYHAKDKALNSLLLLFLENHPFLNQLLQRFLQI